MGIKVPASDPLKEIGSDCSACWNPGETPKFIRAVFTDVTACPHDPPLPPAPNGYVFTMEQNPADPCHWRGSAFVNGAWWDCEYYAVYSYVFLGCGYPYNLSYFYSFWNEECVDYMMNMLTCETGFGCGGFVILTKNLNYVPYIIAHEYNFLPLAGGLYNRNGSDPVVQCYKLANKKDHSNCLFKIDTSEL